MTKPVLGSKLGQHMAREIAQSNDVFSAGIKQDLSALMRETKWGEAQSFLTVARGSSDAAANILSYEFMRVLGKPMTSLPPSVFSIGLGIEAQNTACMVLSQSGASADLVRSAQGLAQQKNPVLAITNDVHSPLAAASHAVVDINAGPELAIPATKTVIGSIAAGLSVLAALSPEYRNELARSSDLFAKLDSKVLPGHEQLVQFLLNAQDVYIVGRDTGFGAAHEVALKIKETCAIHAEAYSASEVLHGPLQLASDRLLVLIIDAQLPQTAQSIDEAQQKFHQSGAKVHVIAPQVSGLTPAAAAAAILRQIYPVILDTALALGLDPDRPAALSKVTQTI